MIVYQPTEYKVRWFNNFPRFEPVFPDSSAVKTFKQCPRKFFFRYVLGYTEKDNPIYFAFGSAVHRFDEICEKAFAKQKSLEECIGLGLQAALVLWGKTPDPPPESKWSFLTKARLIKSLMLIGNEWKKEKARANIEVLSSEQPFNFTLPNGVKRSGRFDQIIETNRRIWGRDRKTTKTKREYYKKQLFPNDQFATYTVAQSLLNGKDVANGEFLSGQYVNVLWNAKGTKDNPDRDGPEVYTEIVALTPSYLSGWIEEAKQWQDRIDDSREKDLYAANEGHCTFCPYHSVCKTNSEMTMKMTLKSEFKFEVWDNSKGDSDDGF